MITKLFQKYKSIILYLIFGVMTTIINMITYWICAHIISFSTIISTIIAWILAVSFAYVSNRKLVFNSELNSKQDILRECLTFFSSRLVTGVIDWIFMFVCVDLLLLNDLFIKFAANIIVIILNYIASKFIIFKKRGENNES